MATNFTCDQSVLNSTAEASFIAYYIVTPIHWLLGTWGHSLSLLAFYKQYKQEKAYVYQIFVASSEMIELQTYVAYITAFYWLAGAEQTGATWFATNYGLVWYAAHLAIPLSKIFNTFALLSSLSMALDRVFALANPIRYENSNQRRRILITFFVCLSISVGTSVTDAFRYFVVEDVVADRYRLSANGVYLQSQLGQILNQTRNAVRILGVLFLVGLNCLIFLFYRRRQEKLANLIINDDDQEKRRKKQQQILLFLTISQSLFIALGTFSFVSFYVTVNLMPASFSSCGLYLLAAVVDAIAMISKFLEFYFVVALNKNFRQCVIDALPCFGKTRVSPVVAIRLSGV